MLQQTRVETVIPYYERFMKAFPTTAALAEADESQVLALWSGLGYYRRAKLLHQGARSVPALPTSARDLESVPGIGRYTAGAIASIAHGEAAPLVDGNVARVIARLFALREDVSRGEGRERVWSIAAALLQEPAASSDPGAFNQSLMELGARICVPRDPRCDECPVRAHCLGAKAGIAARLPVLAPKRAPKAWARVALVASTGGRVLVARRGPSALMGGLWEPPMVDARSKPLADARRIARALEAKVTGAHLAGTVLHVLTHRRMTVDVVLAKLSGIPPGDLAGYDAVRVVTTAQLAALPRSTLCRKLLAVQDNET
jgi:A/G-specific adenine glycosylase